MVKKNKFFGGAIVNDVFPLVLAFSFNESDVMFRKRVDSAELSVPDEEIFILGSALKQKGRTVLCEEQQFILIRPNFIPKTNTEYSFLQHEIFHAVCFVMSQVGMKLSDDSDEAYAYLISFYTREFYDLIDKKQKKKIVPIPA